jgi:3-hydroxy acid dehydrogenase / malonic semialdehyde reductase
MQSLNNKIVLITGASSGIGKACAEQFAALGANLIITARRLERLTKLSEQLSKQHSVKVLPIQLDVQDNIEVEKAIMQLPTEWQSIDILVNNAGLALGTDLMQESNIDNWETMINTNIKGLLYVTRAILPGMVARNSGHIINMGSVAGHGYYPRGNIYAATKHAVKAICHSLRLDLLGTPIRVSEIAPGAVATEFSEVRWHDKERADKFYAEFTALQAEDIADAVLYCATRKPHVNVSELIVFPVDQASVNHIHRSGVGQDPAVLK